MPVTINYPSTTKAYQNALVLQNVKTRNALMENQLKEGPERFRMAQEEHEWRSQLMDWQKEDRPMEKQLKASEWLMKEAPLITWDNYSQSREALIQYGFNPEVLPDPQQIYDEAINQGINPRSYFEAWKEKSLVTLRDRIDQYNAETARIAATKETEPQARAIKTWETPGGKILYIPNNQIPPEGSVPYFKETKGGKITETNKESIIQHYIGSFGAPRNIMGQIQILDPAKRRLKLRGWLQVRKIEQRKGRLGEDDLDRVEQTVMTELGIDEELQHGIRAARMAGATKDDVLKLIKAYEKQIEQIKK